MTTKAEHIDTLARTLYGEAKPHDIQDATAIACVVMNRVALPNWPDDVESVCIQPYQFSCWNTSDPNRARIFKANGAWFDKCVQIAMKAVDHQLVDPTNASTHYHTPAVKPAWSRGKKPVAALSFLGILLAARRAGRNAERVDALENQSENVRKSHEVQDKNRRTLADGDAAERLRDKWSRD